MTNDVAPDPDSDSVIEELRSRAEALEQRLNDAQRSSEQRVIFAELKAEAVRAGILDLDGLKLFDITDLKLSEKGELDDAQDLMARFKRAKPWLFGLPPSSSPLSPPVAQAPRQKHATEMTQAEYIKARAALLKQSH